MSKKNTQVAYSSGLNVTNLIPVAGIPDLSEPKGAACVLTSVAKRTNRSGLTADLATMKNDKSGSKRDFETRRTFRVPRSSELGKFVVI